MSELENTSLASCCEVWTDIQCWLPAHLGVSADLRQADGRDVGHVGDGAAQPHHRHVEPADQSGVSIWSRDPAQPITCPRRG